MSDVSNSVLIASAEGVLNPHRVGDRLFGDVGATLVAGSGRMFSGVCIDTGSGTGFCAEHAAVAAMVTAGEYQVRKIVAVWRNDAGNLYVLPPWGRCREFLRQIDESNLDAEVVLGNEKSWRLRDLLPLHEWPEPLGPWPSPQLAAWWSTAKRSSSTRTSTAQRLKLCAASCIHDTCNGAVSGR